jgi:hypothetical protein
VSVEIVKYSSEYKKVWDAFVAISKNATFLFYRDYMEYHAHRFEDHSLLFYYKNKLVALLPAHVQGSHVCSHNGLTYGGLLTSNKMKAELMLQVFDALVLYFRELSFTAIKYKTIPHIYHQAPADEDLYALFKNSAVVYRRDVLSVVPQHKPVKYSSSRRWRVNRASGFGWDIEQSQDYETFMQLEEKLLKEKYNASPVHTLEEITKLASHFPENIKLYTATKNGEVGAGVVVYETQTVAHCQYIGSTVNGRINGALSILLDYLLTQVYATKKYFDFGPSMDESETGFNNSLLANKESYGGRTVTHDHYLISL